jgi:hypothetical protein
MKAFQSRSDSAMQALRALACLGQRVAVSGLSMGKLPSKLGESFVQIHRFTPYTPLER